MSAALQLPYVWAAEVLFGDWNTAEADATNNSTPTVSESDAAVTEAVPASDAVPKTESASDSDTTENVSEIGLSYHRKHTEKILRRYLYASMLVGRAPAILGEPVSRGWVSCRRIKTFEDAVIFVLDIERCLDRLPSLDRAILSRITLQEYTHVETAAILGVSARAVSYKYPLALDRLTELLRRSDLLNLPSS